MWPANAFDDKSLLREDNSRRHVNIVAAGLSLLVPVVGFSIVCSSMSFYMHFNSPGRCCFIIICSTFVPLIFGVMAALSAKKRRQGDRNRLNWFAFLSATTAFAWVFAIAMGKMNYSHNTWNYYEWMSLRMYPFIDPSGGGKALMDAGRIVFSPGTHVDRAHSLAFKSVNTYCIAPVVSASGTMPYHDFWVAGVNCCGEHTESDEINFQCGEGLSGSTSGGGFRVLDTELLPFYRLAAQQAGSKYGMNINYPIFLTWSKDPVGDVNAFGFRGVRDYFLSVLLFFGIQLLLVVTTLITYSYQLS